MIKACNELEEYQSMDYEMLHHKFKNRRQRLVFRKEIVVERLVRRYQAVEIDKGEITDLINDDQLVYDYIFCCLKIDDPRLLQKIFTSQEQADFQWEINDNLHRNRTYPFKGEKEAAYIQLILDEMEGRRIDVVLESLDGEHVTGFLVRNQSEEVGSYIWSLTGGAHFANEKVKKMVIQARQLTDEEYQSSYMDYLEELQRWNLV